MKRKNDQNKSRQKPKANSVFSSPARYQRVTEKPEGFVEFMRKSPLYGVKLDLKRQQTATRRNNMQKVLERNEKMTILEHPFFGMKKARVSAEREMDKHRGGRHRAI